MTTINIGIVAHVDAGKTSLTERVLYETHVIDTIGRVDEGTTQTDTLDLERRRGITIKASVVSFHVDGLKVNLIDTPGHADFLAEVERSLAVLDCAVLLISAVEGIQPQTRVLFSALTHLDIPTIFFVNKIDRAGAQADRLLDRIRQQLTPRILPLYQTTSLGTKAASVAPCSLDDPAFRAACLDQLVLADDALLDAYVEGESITDAEIHDALRRQVARATLFPVVFGSALTGVGVHALLDVVASLAPVSGSQDCDPLSGIVFKLEKVPTGEKIAYVRLFGGSLCVKSRVTLQRRGQGGNIQTFTDKVQKLHVFCDGRTVQTPRIGAGEFCKVWGLRDARIDDIVGEVPPSLRAHHFAVPHLEARIDSVDPGLRHDLYQALQVLAEEDPLIAVVRDNADQALYLRFFGEVQREVIESMLADRFGLAVRFAETGVVCVEKPGGIGEAIEVMGAAENPFIATVGFRVAPGPPNSGVTYHRPSGALPLAYYRVIEDAARATLAQGLYGWEVTDIVITLIATARTPATTGTDFRNLTPLALMGALANAGAVVYEPVNQFELSVPTSAIGTAMFKLAALGATYAPPLPRGESDLLTGTLPLVATEPFKRELASFTGGEGVFIARDAGVRRKEGAPPTRHRHDWNPLNRKEYLLHVQRVR